MLPKEKLLDKVLEAIRGFGWRFRVTQTDHPFRIAIWKNQSYEELRIYIWNVTHGGGEARPADEYRIQLTGVPENRLDVSPPPRTLLLGWDARNEVFAGYNAFRYASFGHSPSLQVKESTLVKAKQDGMAFQPKERDEDGNVVEVVVAFRPEFFVPYATNLDRFHRAVMTNEELGLLREAAVRPIQDQEVAILPEERRRAIRYINQAIRDARFRKIVLDAYGWSCAICGLQLDIIEAAHIVQVKDKGTDEAINGVALCPNHHEAMDSGLVLIDPSYRIIINESKLKQLHSSGLAGGLEEFLKSLRPNETIRLPKKEVMPNPEYLRQRMRIEGFHLA